MTRPVFGVDLDPAVIEANATRTKSGSLKRNPLLAVYGPGPEGAKCDGRWRHASGDDYEGCVACWIDQDEEGLTAPNIRPCTTPEDDPDDPGFCRWCSHTVERAA